MIDEDSPPVVTEIHGSIAVVRFNRPALRNPLSRDPLRELRRTTSALFPRNDIQAIIFTGINDVFASGANIRELAQLDTEAALEFSRLGQDLFQTIAAARQVTIAAINGYCMGGGLDLALACDIRVASKSAIFSHPGAKLGDHYRLGRNAKAAANSRQGARPGVLCNGRPLLQCCCT